MDQILDHVPRLVIGRILDEGRLYSVQGATCRTAARRTSVSGQILDSSLLGCVPQSQWPDSGQRPLSC